MRQLPCQGFISIPGFYFLFQGSISIPGAIGLSEVEHLSDPVEGFNELVPMVFHYGHISPDSNQKLYRSLTSQVALMFEKKCEISKPSNKPLCNNSCLSFINSIFDDVLNIYLFT